MKIYVVGGSKNKFLPLDNIRERFIVDQKHEGKNIDFLNPWYCELTGLYYLHYNVTDEIVGLEHYRNYFWKNGHPITEDEIKEELTKGDIICGGFKYPWSGSITLRQELDKVTRGTLPIFLKHLKQMDEGLYNFFNKYLDGQQLWCCNVFIGPKKIIDEWCKFIFPLLAEFETESRIGPGTNMPRREGYFTEFLFGAWLIYNKYKIIGCEMHKFRHDLHAVEFIIPGIEHQNIML